MVKFSYVLMSHLEERRKRMLKHFKVRAERDGKNDSVENGIL